MNSKRKGTRAEHELLRLLLSRGIPAKRNDQRYVGGRNNPDVRCQVCGMPVHVEVKRMERLNIHLAMNQAFRDADGQAFPVVAHRRSREPWLVTMPLEALLEVLGYVPGKNGETFPGG